MKPKLVLLALTCAIFSSCDKEEESKYDSLLTSKTWGQPTVLHRPGNLGYWSEATCPAGQATVFYRNGNYLHNNYCLNNTLDGKWSWIVQDDEIMLEIFYKGIKQRTSIVTIIELSDSLLVTREREQNEPVESYFELKYKPRVE
jgi:hypothetical protein